MKCEHCGKDKTRDRTVAQAAVAYARDNVPYDVDVRSEHAETFEAGAAWMRERVLQAAPCNVCRWEKTLHVGARFADHEWQPPAWLTGRLTALCASDAEKEAR